MGMERAKLSGRFTEANAEFIAQLCERWSPVVEGVSATLNLIVAVVRRMEADGRIDLSLAAIQRLLCGHRGRCVQDSVAAGSGAVASAQSRCAQGSAGPSVGWNGSTAPVIGEAAAGSQGRLLKRPPRRIRPTTGVRAAVLVSGLADASLFTPFYGLRRTFAIGA